MVAGYMKVLIAWSILQIELIHFADPLRLPYHKEFPYILTLCPWVCQETKTHMIFSQ